MWLLMWLQKRRRARAAQAGPQLPTPAVIGGWSAWGDTDPAWADNYVTIQLEPPEDGEFEVWERDSHHTSHLLGTIPAVGLVDYHHVMAAAEADICYYKVRLRVGAEVGAFSNEYGVTVEAPP